MHRPIRRAGLALLVALAAVALPAWSPAAAGAAPAAPAGPPRAPTGVTATRDPKAPVDFTVAWKPVSGAVDHYNVSVFSGGQDHVTIVPAGTTALAVSGVDLSTTYRITVSSRDATGAGATSGPIWLRAAVPSPPKELAVDRSGDQLDLLTVGWAAPEWGGYSAVSGYHLRVVRMADRSVVIDKVITETKVELGGLDALRQYSVKVAAVNDQGESATAGSLSGSAIPAPPGALKATRDDANPDLVHLEWTPVVSAKKAATVVRYEVVFGSDLRTATVVRSDGPTMDVKIPAEAKGITGVRACSDLGCSYLSPKQLVGAYGVPVKEQPKKTTSPFVGMSDNAGVVSVETAGVIGSRNTYPNLYVQILPTAANGGFSDFQWAQNGAQAMTFRTVPQGTYVVVAYGVDDKGSKTELARKVIVVGGDGLVTANEWEVVSGKAKITDGKIEMPYNGENRVLSTRPRTSSDVVLTTDARLDKGWGYGVFFKTDLDSAGRLNGYSFQYDPMWGNRFIIRHWYRGQECAQPLAATAFPSDMAVNATHRLVVVAQGDSLWASIDGRRVFNVTSLTDALAKEPCHWPAPTGTRIGFRTWQVTTASFTGTFLGTSVATPEAKIPEDTKAG